MRQFTSLLPLTADLKVGQYLLCKVEEVKNEGRVVKLSAPPSVAKSCVESSQGWNLTNLLPGLLVKASIKKVHRMFTHYVVK